MGAQPPHVALQGDNHPPDIFGDAFGINEQRRRRDLLNILHQMPVSLHSLFAFIRVHWRLGLYSAISKIASISTAIFPGNDPIPTALRAPIPFSFPNTSANNSLQPLITAG